MTSSALADSLTALLNAAQPQASGYAARLHAALAQGGWWNFFSLGFGTAEDGIELGEALAAAEQLGAYGSPPTVLMTVGFLVPLLDSLPNSALAQRLRSRIDAGEIIGIALPPGEVSASGPRIESGARLNGEVGRVLAADAPVVLVPLKLDGGLAFAIIETAHPGVTVAFAETVVIGQFAGRVSLRALTISSENLVANVDARGVRRAADIFSLLLDCHAVGIAAECLRRSVEYTSTRRQFGQPVGAFQAVQHMAADILVRVETGRSITRAAASAFVAGEDDTHNLLRVSRLHCAECAQTAAEIAIQMHGGAGFTWEVGLHHLYRAAMFARHALTNEPALRRELAQRIRQGVRVRLQTGEAA